MVADGSYSARQHREHKTFVRTKLDLQMPIPNAILLEAKIGVRGAANAKRKTAGHQFGARLFAIKNFELQHYKILLGTLIRSFGKTCGSLLGSLLASYQFTVIFCPVARRR